MRAYKYRFQMDMTPVEREELDEVRGWLSLTRADVIRKALVLFRWYIQSRKEGWSICRRKETETETLVIL